jgi:hypothetical protein
VTGLVAIASGEALAAGGYAGGGQIALGRRGQAAGAADDQ